METQEYKLCKRGHVRSPENLYANGSCKICAKAASRKTLANIPVLERRFCQRGHDLKEHGKASNGACLKCAKDRLAKYHKDHYKPKPKKRFCVNGHERLPENVYANGECKLCQLSTERRDARREYGRSPAGRLRDSARNKKPERKKSNRVRWEKSRDELLNTYVIRTLKIPSSTATPELINLKRQQLLFKRELKQLKQAIKGD